MSCEPCTRALTQRHHEFTSACRGCMARTLSRAPDFIRDRYLETLESDERVAMLEAARAEYRREQLLPAEVAA